MFQSKSCNYVPQKYFGEIASPDMTDSNPQNLDLNISIVGSTIRKIIKAIPGRNLWMNEVLEPILRSERKQWLLAQLILDPS